MNQYKATVVCPHCGKKENIRIQSLLDTSEDPSLEEKVLSGACFTHTCSRCHGTYPIVYSCMYHDSQRKLLISLSENEKDLEEMRLRLNGRYHADRLDETLNGWLQNCHVRIVTGEYQMQEKILMAHFGLDDRIVEMGRYELLKELQEQRNDIQDLLFNTDGENYVFLVLTDHGIDGSVPFTDEMYDSFAKKYPDILKDESIEINPEWAETEYGKH